MTPVSSAGADMMTTEPTTKALASQNLFEHMASQANASSFETSPSELGSNLLDNLDGFFDRVSSFSQQASVTESQTPERLAPVSMLENSAPAPDAGDKPSAIDNEAMTQVVNSLGRVFDHSIETSMVVRGATQVSGSANTLLKGQ